MESDGVDISGLYFSNTASYVGTFMASTHQQGDKKEKEEDTYTSQEIPSKVTAGCYLMIEGDPCTVERRLFYGDSQLEGGGYYKFFGKGLFTSFRSGTRGGVVKSDYEMKTLDAAQFVKVPAVQKYWWEVQQVIADQKTPEMPDAHDVIVLKNPAMLIFSPGCPPGELRLHALQANSDIFIDMITEQLKPSQKVEVRVLNACGQNEIIMNNFIKDIKITKR